jgi:hypothetical protein
MASRKVITYCSVGVEMDEHELCEVEVKGGQREVEVVRHGEPGA